MHTDFLHQTYDRISTTVTHIKLSMTQKLLHSLYQETCGHKLGRGHIMGRFCPSCACLVYFLRKSTQFYVNQIECQRILFRFLLIILSSFLRLMRFGQLMFQRPNAPDNTNHSPSTTIVFISAILRLKQEGYLHREDRGGMMMGLSIEGRGVT